MKFRKSLAASVLAIGLMVSAPGQASADTTFTGGMTRPGGVDTVYQGSYTQGSSNQRAYYIAGNSDPDDASISTFYAPYVNFYYERRTPFNVVYSGSAYGSASANGTFFMCGSS